MFINVLQKIRDMHLQTKIFLFVVVFVMIPSTLFITSLARTLSNASSAVQSQALEETTQLVKEQLVNTVKARSQIYDVALKNVIVDLGALQDKVVAGEPFLPALASTYYKHNQIASSMYFIGATGTLTLLPTNATLKTDVVDIKSRPELLFILDDKNSKAGRWVGPYHNFKTEPRVITWAGATGADGYKDIQKDEDIVSFIIPVWQDDHYLGTFGLDITLKTLFEQIVRIDPSESSYVFIARATGEYLSTSDEIKRDFSIPESTESSLNGSPLVADEGLHDVFFTTSSVQEGSFILPQNNSGGQKIVTYSAIPSFNGKLFVVSPLNELTKVQVEKARRLEELINVLDPIHQTRILHEETIAFDALRANSIGGILSAEWMRVLLYA